MLEVIRARMKAETILYGDTGERSRKHAELLEKQRQAIETKALIPEHLVADTHLSKNRYGVSAEKLFRWSAMDMEFRE